ncbi:MAG: aspartate aminotransferase family protein [Anaerolineales bacterium]|nr:aspartate aminotransferase family protein [Anaerolineales bacterium]
MTDAVNLSPEIIQKESQYVLGTYPRAPFVFEKGEGMYVYDSDGKAYLDFGSGIAVNALGHNDPDVVASIQEQAAQLSHVCNLYHTVPHVELAEMLCNLSFADKVFFSNSGAEAVEAALKFARKYALKTSGPGKSGIVAFEDGFHGRTYGALSVTAREKYQAPFRPLVPGVTIAPFNDIAAARQLIGPDICAVIVEPMQGEGGIHVATPEFLTSLREQCDQVGALLIFDEIQCGMGRTGKLWAYEHYGVKPDMMTLAKALGGGLPIGATLLTDAVAAVIEPGDHGSTFGGGPVVCRAAQVVLEKISDPEILAHVVEMGAYLAEKLLAIDTPHIQEIRMSGLMVGVEMDFDVRPLLGKGYAEGLLLLNAGTNVLRLLPPLIVEKEHIDACVAALEAILD